MYYGLRGIKINMLKSMLLSDIGQFLTKIDVLVLDKNPSYKISSILKTVQCLDSILKHLTVLANYTDKCLIKILSGQSVLA